MHRVRSRTLVFALLLLGAALGVRSQPDVPFVQSPEQVYNEMPTVYYGNLMVVDELYRSHLPIVLRGDVSYR